MSDPTKHRSTPDSETSAGLLDFWAVYEANQPALVERSLAHLRDHPVFGPMIRAATPEQMATQNAEGVDRLRRAVNGDWNQYDDSTRATAVLYARSGIGFSTWYEIMRVFAVDMAPYLVTAYGAAPPRLARAFLAMQFLTDHGMALFGDAYLAAKEDALRESERSRVSTELRLRELEAEAARNALHTTQSLLETFIANVKDYAVVLLDPAGCVQSWNDGAARIQGYQASEVIGQHFSLFYPADDAADGAPGRHLGVASEDGRIECDGWRVRKDGTRFWASVVITPLRGADGELKGFGKVTRDFTERKHAEEALVESEGRYRQSSVELELQNRRVSEASRMKSEFLANMSHELRTPLNAIIGFSELIVDGVVKPEVPEFNQFMADILASGRHLQQLINDVLDLSKVEAGKLDFHPEAADLAQISGEVTGILRTTAAERGIRVDLEIGSEFSDLSIDRARLKQVLYNYLSNALKFSPEGSHVTVRAQREGPNMFRLEVEDAGIGIAPDDISRLFVEFQQLDTGTAKRHQGTGLGLALTKRIVEAQGGSVGVRSSVGKGSVFYAVLPMRALNSDGVPTSVRPPQERGEPTLGPHVLVVEDDQNDQTVLVRLLTEAGYSVEVASTGAQAIALCSTQTFAAVTLDLLLPDTSGVDVLRQIRTSGPNKDVPVIVITVVTDRGVAAGFAVQDILPKPIDPQALLQSLKAANVSPGAPGSVLVVDDDPVSLKLTSAALTTMGYDAICMLDAETALRASPGLHPAAVVLDLLMPGVDGFQFLERFRKLPGCASVPVVVWTGKELGPIENARLRNAAQAIVQKGKPGTSMLLSELRTFLPARSEPAGRAST